MALLRWFEAAVLMAQLLWRERRERKKDVFKRLNSRLLCLIKTCCEVLEKITSVFQ